MGMYVYCSLLCMCVHYRRLGLQRWPGRKLRAKVRRGEDVAMGERPTVMGRRGARGDASVAMEVTSEPVNVHVGDAAGAGGGKHKSQVMRSPRVLPTT